LGLLESGGEEAPKVSLEPEPEATMVWAAWVPPFQEEEEAAADLLVSLEGKMGLVLEVPLALASASAVEEALA